MTSCTDHNSVLILSLLSGSYRVPFLDYSSESTTVRLKTILPSGNLPFGYEKASHHRQTSRLQDVGSQLSKAGSVVLVDAKAPSPLEVLCGFNFVPIRFPSGLERGFAYGGQ